MWLNKMQPCRTEPYQPQLPQLRPQTSKKTKVILFIAMRESDLVSDQWVSKGVYQDSSTANYKLPYPDGLKQNWELICSCNKTFRNIGFRQNCFQIPKWCNLDSVSFVLPVQPSRLLAAFLDSIPHCGLKATTAAPALTPSVVEAQLNNKKLLARIPRKKSHCIFFFSWSSRKFILLYTDSCLNSDGGQIKDRLYMYSEIVPTIVKISWP